MEPRTDPSKTVFGGPAFRSRFTDAVWQGPTWSFAILLVVLRLTDGDQVDRFSLVAGFVVVMAVTSAAILVRWERVPPWSQVLLPLGDLAGSVLMVVADPGGASVTVLILSLPVVWLAFEFDVAGMVVGVAVTTATVLTTVLLRPAGSQAGTRADDVSGVLVTGGFVVGLGVVAWLMGGILRGIGETLRGRADEVETARALSEERFATMTSVMDTIDVAVLVLRPDAEPLLNGQAMAMLERLSLTPEGLATGSPRSFPAGGRVPLPPEEQAINRALAGEEFAGVEERIGDPGDQRTVVMSARQLAGPAGGRGTCVLVAWDCTDLVDAVAVREDFLATVSHELRTPLTAIIASMEMATELAPPGHPDGLTSGPGVVGAVVGVGSGADAATELAWLLSAVTRNTTLLKERIDHLLSSVESAGAFAPRRTDVSELVLAAVTKHESQVLAGGLRLRTVVDPGVVAELDPTAFEQIVDNLVSNAVKYTGTGGEVHVALQGRDTHLVLEVGDTGIGMTYDEQRQVFDRFYRTPRVRSGTIHGLGIGLSLVRSLVDRHHGTVGLQSLLGEGTTVTVTLPQALRR